MIQCYHKSSNNPIVTSVSRIIFRITLPSDFQVSDFIFYTKINENAEKNRFIIHETFSNFTLNVFFCIRFIVCRTHTFRPLSMVLWHPCQNDRFHFVSIFDCRGIISEDSFLKQVQFWSLSFLHCFVGWMVGWW